MIKLFMRQLFQFLFHPVSHVSVYAFIIVGSIYFYGPLVMMHMVSLIYFQWHGLAGLLGMILTLLSLLKNRKRMHLCGTILMLLSTIPYLAFSIHGIPQITFYHPVTLTLGSLFIIQSFFILLRILYTPTLY